MMLKFVKVSKIYNRKRQIYSLLDANISFEEQKNVAILTDNEHSSTAIMDLISGIQQPTRGKILREGVFSGPLGTSSYLHRELSGEENIRFISKVYNQNTNRLLKDIRNFSSINKELKNKLKSYTPQLRRRISISISLLMKSDIYLLKDSLSHPDEIFNQNIQKKLTELAKDSTLITVTNKIKLAKKYSEQAMIIDKFGHLEHFTDFQTGINLYNQKKITEKDA